MIIKGVLNLANSNIESLGNLKKVKDNLSLHHCKNLGDLGDLEYVGENLDLEYCSNLKSLSKLKKVKGISDLTGCENLENLGDLMEIGNMLILTGCENLKSPGKLKSSHKINSNVTDLGFENLGLITEISFDILANLRKLKSFGNLKKIIQTGSSWYHKYSIPEDFEGFNNNFDSFDFDLEIFFPLVKKLKSLNPIKKIEGNLKIGGYGITGKNQFYDMSSVEYINGDLDLYYYPNDILKINNSLEIAGKIFVNTYTNPKCYENFPKKLKLKMIDKWDYELLKKKVKI